MNPLADKDAAFWQEVHDVAERVIANGAPRVSPPIRLAMATSISMKIKHLAQGDSNGSPA